MDKNLKAVLIFLVVLVVLFWLMPDTKVTTIGDFFEKVITPICIAIGGPLIVKRLVKVYKKS